MDRNARQIGGLLLGAAVLLYGCDEPAVIGQACDMVPGDLVITEVMPNPTGESTGSDRGHEWFEVYNATGETKNLDRIILWREGLRRDGTGERKGHVVRKAGSLGPGEYFVFGDGVVGVAPIDYSYDPEQSPLGQYTSDGFGERFGEMTNISDTFGAGGIVIECSGRVIDRMLYGDVGARTPLPGQSLYLDGDIGPDALLNDRREWWCIGGDTYDQLGNVGTPGEANQRCGLVRCEEDGVFRDGHPPGPGDLIITELLLDPAGSADSRKYWFEVFVAADEPVDINGLLVGSVPMSAVSESTLVETIEIGDTACITGQPGEYLVIGESSGEDLNGDVDVDAVAPGFGFETETKNIGGVLVIFGYNAEIGEFEVIEIAGIPPRIETSRDLRSRVECRDGEDGINYLTREECECNDPTDCPPDPSLGRRSGCRWDPIDEECEGGGGKNSGRTYAYDAPALELPEAAELNNFGPGFCYSPDIPATEGHFDGIGTPGLPNFPCGTVACCPSDCCSELCSTTPDAYRAVQRPDDGDVVISEVYTSASGADVNKEWIEVYVANGPVDINGLWVWHDEFDRGDDPPTTNSARGWSSTDHCARGETGDYLLVSIYSWQYLLVNGVVPDNSGVAPDTIALVSSTSGFLDNSPSTDVDKSIRISWGSDSLDSVPSTFPPEGTTQMLRPEYLDIVANNDVDSFCEPVLDGLFEGEGTPGLPNVCGQGCFVSGSLACASDCTLDTDGCFGRPTWCGDGDAAGAEQCDGVDLRQADCTTLGFTEGILTCDVDCKYDSTQCTPPRLLYCGNGIRDFGEVCDGTNLSGATCFTRGFTGGGVLACGADCNFDTSGCLGTGPECGNDLLEPGESCDGDQIGPSTCVSLGFGGGVPREPVPPQPGDLAITEIYADPPGSDAGRDWIEIVSLSATPFDLNQLTVRSSKLNVVPPGNVNQFTVDDVHCVEVQPGDYAVIGGQHAADDGAVPDGTVGSETSTLFYASDMAMEICLDHPSPEETPCVFLVDETAIVDAQASRSWSLDPLASFPDLDNDTAANWSLSTAGLNGFLYSGSPGVENEP